MAIKHRQIESVKLILDTDPSLLNEEFCDGVPYLGAAMECEEIFFEFIKRGADPQRVGRGESPITLLDRAVHSIAKENRKAFQNPAFHNMNIPQSVMNYLFDARVPLCSPEGRPIDEHIQLRYSEKFKEAFTNAYTQWKVSRQGPLRFMNGKLSKKYHIDEAGSVSALRKFPYDVSRHIVSYLINEVRLPISEGTRSSRVVYTAPIPEGKTLHFVYEDEPYTEDKPQRLHPALRSKDGPILMLRGAEKRSFRLAYKTSEGAIELETGPARTIGTPQLDRPPQIVEGAASGGGSAS